MKKVCKRCRRTLDVAQFYKHSEMKDGYLNFCKDCVKARMKQYREKNHDFVLIKDRIRNRKTDAVKKRREYAREKKLENPELYNKTMASYLRKSRENNPGKNSARLRLNRAVLSGAIKRPDACSECGKKCKPEAHHEDYSKPLKVIWLCNECHAKTRRIETTATTVMQDCLEENDQKIL